MPDPTFRGPQTVTTPAKATAHYLREPLLTLTRPNTPRLSVIRATKQIESVRAVIGDELLRSVRLREEIGVRLFTALQQEMDA